MMKDVVAPLQAPPREAPSKVSPSRQSVRMNGGLTYDTVETTQVSPSKPAPVSTKRWSTKSKAADHYIKPSSPTKSKSPIRGGRKSFTKSPTDRKVIHPYTSSNKYEPALPPVEAVPANPDLPVQLVEEFKKTPTNYNKIDALLNGEHFESTLNKWKELGILFAEDIIRNSSTPIDYHLRVAENDLESGFGQVDKMG